MSLIPGSRSSATALARSRAIDGTDLFLAVTFIIVCVALGSLLVPLQISQYRWEQAARAAFDARQTEVVAPLQPLFDFAAHERFINGVAGGLFAVTVELLLLANACSLTRLIRHWVPSYEPSAQVANELRAIRRTVERLAEHRRAPSSVPSEDSQRLRASADACFRISRGAVSRYLAQELEELGETLRREADEIEGVRHSDRSC